MERNSKSGLLWFILGIVYSVAVVFLLDWYLASQGYAYRKVRSAVVYEDAQDPLEGWSVVPVLGDDESVRTSPGFPVRLKIPKINVDSAIEYVGMTPTGIMDVPKSRDEVGWFKLGRRPGENGSAVIAGHYGIQNRKGSAFDNLHKLRKGDRLTVENDLGETVTFIVRETRRFDPKADSAEVFGSIDGKPHLNLVTCEGEWDVHSQEYPKRLVVFTDKEEVASP